MKLHGYFRSAAAYRVRIALNLKGLPTQHLPQHLRKGEQGTVDPYLQAGLGFYALSSEHLGLDSLGTGFQLGGGFDWYAIDALSLGLRVRYHGIAMGPPEGRDNDVFISAATVEGSIVVHF